MRVRWTAPAAADLEHINNYLSEHYPRLARSTVRRIYDGVRSLKSSPHRGPVGRRTGTRELVLSPLPYIVVYWIRDETAEVLRIYHGAQRRA
jgi:toxin ParE1/3/4